MNGFNLMGGGNSAIYPKTNTSSYFSPTAPTNNIIWVQGIEGAKAWQLSPNSMAILLDSEVEGKMYIKVSDNIGMSSLRIFNFVEETKSSLTNVVSNGQDLDLSAYVTKEELANIIKELKEQNEQSIQSTTTRTTEQPATIASKAKSVTILSK